MKISDKKVIPLADPAFNGNSGVAGFISWDRLQYALHANGELRDGERIAGYVVEDVGISFYIEKA